MTENISKFPLAGSKAFSLKYPRIQRENFELIFDYLSEEMRQYYPPFPPIRKFANVSWESTKDEPQDGLSLIFERDLRDEFLNFNNILLLRVLKEIYQEPDLLAVPFKRTSKKLVVLSYPKMDWGYTLKITDYMTAEIRSLFANQGQFVRFWYDSSYGEADEKKLFVNAAWPFLRSLENLVLKNKDLLKEKAELKKDTTTCVGIFNIFSERYRAAEKLVKLAYEMDKPLDVRFLKLGEKVPESTLGYIFLSAATMYCTAIESLINIIYHRLLKQEFFENKYELKRIQKMGVEFRLVAIHLFCEGFNDAAVPAHTELWKKFLKLRSFRNNVVHGNITEEHNWYELYEHPVMCTYLPAKSFRGTKAEEEYEGTFSPSMSNVGSDVVAEIRTIVDEIVAALLGAMDAQTREWVNGWLHQHVIHERPTGRTQAAHSRRPRAR